MGGIIYQELLEVELGWKVYTGYGDKGMTDLSHTKNVSKSDDRICLMGSVEELMNDIGLVRVLFDDVDVVRMLEKISETLKKIVDGVSDPYNREFRSVKTGRSFWRRRLAG